MNNIWKYIKADSFFADFLPHIKSHKFKIRGFNSRNNPIDFSKEELKEIKKALKDLPTVRKKQTGSNGA
jgi:hypothetical protein